jgi:hypothetical protein
VIDRTCPLENVIEASGYVQTKEDRQRRPHRRPKALVDDARCTRDG